MGDLSKDALRQELIFDCYIDSRMKFCFGIDGLDVIFNFEMNCNILTCVR